MREDQNLVLTGGWDRTIKLFDLRAGGPVAHFFGAELSADSLDQCGDLVVAGSYRPNDSLQVYDLKTMKVFQTIEWEYGSTFCDTAYLNTVRFNKNGKVILAGSKTNDLKFYEQAYNSEIGTDDPFFSQNSRHTQFTGSVMCANYMYEQDCVAVGGGDGTV